MASLQTTKNESPVNSAFLLKTLSGLAYTKLYTKKMKLTSIARERKPGIIFLKKGIFLKLIPDKLKIIKECGKDDRLKIAL